MSLILTPHVTAGVAYPAGAVVGGLMAFSHASDASLNMILESMAVSIASAQSSVLKAYLFSGNPVHSTFTDALAPVLNAADAPLLLGAYTFPLGDSGLGAHTIYNFDGMAKQVQLRTRTLYVVLVAVAAVTFTTTADVTFTIASLTI